MNRKPIITIVLLGICSIWMSACNEKNNRNEPKSDTYLLTPHKYNLDYSQELSDLSVIKEQKITEARIYDQDHMYSTHDEDVIKNIIEKIVDLNLKEVEKIAPDAVGYSELFLMNGEKVVYHFVSSKMVNVGNKQYGTMGDEEVAFWKNVMVYCRQTFWN